MSWSWSRDAVQYLQVLQRVAEGVAAGRRKEHAKPFRYTVKIPGLSGGEYFRSILFLRHRNCKTRKVINKS